MKKLILLFLAALTVSVYARPYLGLKNSEIKKDADGKEYCQLDGGRLLDTLSLENLPESFERSVFKRGRYVVIDATLLDFDEEKDEARVRGSKGVVKITKPIWEAYQEAGGGNKYFDVWILKEGDKLVLGIKGLHKGGK